MGKIRVLILSHIYPNKMYPYYGCFIHNQTKYILKAGCQVRVISPSPYAPKILWFRPKWESYGFSGAYDKIDKVPVYYPRYILPPGKWGHSLSCFTMYCGIYKFIHSLIKEFKPNILHAHTATADGYVGLILKRKYDLPLICSLRGSDINLYPYRDKLTMLLTKKVISEADQIVSVSHAIKTAAEVIAKPKRSIKVVYNGCDFKLFSYSEEKRTLIRNKLGISRNAKIIIFVGKITKNKGIFDLITAFKKLSSKYTRLHLIIVGYGPEYDALEKLLSFNNFNKKVHLVGRQPQRIIHNYLSAADVFVLPSYDEGLPNALLEAMSCGLPVIATKVGGIPEAIEDRKSGILINSKDVESISKAIENILKDEESTKRMGINGKQIVEQKFSWVQNTEKMINIYEENGNAKS